MTTLHHFLPQLVLPIGVSLLLLAAGIFWRKWWCVGLAAVVLYVSSSSTVATCAIRSAEGWATRVPADSAGTTDAIVVLSGGLLAAPGPPPASDWQLGDRYTSGLALFRDGKAPRLIFTGGPLPWEALASTEGDLFAAHARAQGVPDSLISVTGPVPNTSGEARAVAALLRDRSAKSAGPPPQILLVTSAFHMARAARRFEGAGLRVRPFPVDFQASAVCRPSWSGLVPSAAALAQTELALHERYGRWYDAIAMRLVPAGN